MKPHKLFFCAVLALVTGGHAAVDLGLEHWLKQGRAQIQAGKIDLAERSFRKALTLDDRSKPALLGLAKCYEISGDLESSLKYQSKADKIQAQDKDEDSEMEEGLKAAKREQKDAALSPTPAPTMAPSDTPVPTFVPSATVAPTSIPETPTPVPATTSVAIPSTVAAELSAPKFMDQGWFVYFGLGYPKIIYPSDIREALDPGQNFQSLTFDLFGFYWPLKSRKTLLGFVATIMSDDWRMPGTATKGETLEIIQRFYAFSYLHSLQGELGDGAFIRADLGYAGLALWNVSPAAPVLNRNLTSWGVGANLGVGYFLGSSPGHRYPVTLLYSPRVVDDDRTLYQSVSLIVGVLW